MVIAYDSRHQSDTFAKEAATILAANGIHVYLFEELKNKGYGDLVYETVNSNSLSAFVKEQMAENNDTLPNWLIGLVRVFEKTTVTVRKTSK